MSAAKSRDSFSLLFSVIASGSGRLLMFCRSGISRAVRLLLRFQRVQKSFRHPVPARSVALALSKTDPRTRGVDVGEFLEARS